MLVTYTRAERKPDRDKWTGMLDLGVRVLDDIAVSHSWMPPNARSSPSRDL